MRNILITTTLLTLTACGGFGTPYTASEPAKGRGSVVVYQTAIAVFGTFGGQADITANGKECTLGRGEFTRVDVAAGEPVRFTYHAFLDRGHSEVTVAPMSGQTVYVELAMNTGKLLAGAAGGAIASAAMSISSNGEQTGNMVFLLGNEEDATKTADAGCS